MNKILLLLVSILAIESAIAQKGTFDLATYTIAKGWNKQAGDNTLVLSKEDEKTGVYCLITLYKAIPGTANSKENFDLAWLSLVKEMVTVAAPPELQPVSTENGWETQSGYAAFESNGNKGVVILATSTAAEKMVNLIILTNTDVFEKEMTAFLKSISLKKQDPAPAAQLNNASPPSAADNSIVGVWGITASDQNSVRVNTGTAATIFRQYTFNANGTYNFIVKTFDPLMDKIFLGKETGSYEISGSSITVIPKKSVLEAWSKKNGSDWGKLLTTQAMPSEKTGYTFTKQYIADINEWQLILQAGQPTKRDGPYNFTLINNAWIYIVPSAARPEIKLPAGTQISYEGIVPEAEKKKEPVQPAGTNNNENILGTWSMTSSDQSSNAVRNGTNGYITRQYTLNANGTYTFIIKTFQYTSDKLLLTRESGTYRVDGTSITMSPQQSVIESWSKKDGVDKWDKLISSQKQALEKTTYQFTRHYFEGIKQWNLVLQATQPTKRDGPYSRNTTYSNAWYYVGTSANNPVIELPGEGQPSEKSNVASVTQPAAGGFTYTTTNFDDGWTSVVKENWVEVTKGKYKVLLHYPNEGIKAANSDIDVMCSAAWNFLVAPRYSNLRDYKITPSVIDYERPYYAEGLLTDNETNTVVFVALFKKATGWMEFITPDKKAFIETFGLDISTVGYYSESNIWDKLKQMVNYNKFAIATPDFPGTWKDRFSASTYYTNIYTGNSAGMSTYSSSQVFEFGSNNQYKWSLVMANSFQGTSKFASAKGSGTFKVLNNWQLHFSEMEGKPKTYDAYFSCVKGGRILWMNDATFSGNKVFTGYSRE